MSRRRVAVAAVVVLLAATGSVVGFEVSGGLGSTAAADPSSSDWTTFSDGSVSFDHPPAWTSYPPGPASTMSATVAYLSTVPFGPVCTTTTDGENESTECHGPQPDLGDGGVMIDWTAGFMPGSGSVDRYPGVPTVVGGASARVDHTDVSTECTPTHAVAAVRAAITSPSSGVLTMTACIGPGDVDADRAAVDRMLASVRFGGDTNSSAPPSVSPTASPTVSPTASPSATPTGASSAPTTPGWTSFAGDQLSFEHPTTWTTYPAGPANPGPGPQSIAYFSTTPYGPTCAPTNDLSGSPMTACHLPEPDLSGGGTFVSWTYGGLPRTGGVLDGYSGTLTTIDGADAKIDRTTVPRMCVPTHAVGGVVAAIAVPAANAVLVMTACLGPGDLDGQSAAVDRMLGSVQLAQ